MTKERCETCKFWNSIKFKDDGQCRARPPVFVYLPGQPQYGHWPITASTEYCGEYHPKQIEGKK